MQGLQNKVQRLRGNQEGGRLLGEHAAQPERTANGLQGVHQSTLLTCGARLHHLSQLPLERMHHLYVLKGTRAQATVPKLQSRAGDLAMRQLQLFLRRLQPVQVQGQLR